MANENYVLQYGEIDKCWMCYYLVKDREEISSDNECCFRYSVKGEENIICSTETISCEAKIKILMKKMHSSCNAKKNIHSLEPLTCGNETDYKNEILNEKVARVQKTNKTKTPLKEKVEKALAEVFIF